MYVLPIIIWPNLTPHPRTPPVTLAGAPAWAPTAPGAAEHQPGAPTRASHLYWL